VPARTAKLSAEPSSEGGLAFAVAAVNKSAAIRTKLFVFFITYYLFLMFVWFIREVPVWTYGG
jgi:hypothetical protein